VFITLEDAEIKTLFDRDLKAFVKLYIRPYKYIFIDEFQYARDGGQSLKFIYDTVGDKKIFISGSSILELSIKTVKYLAGRIFSFTLFPLTFKEYLSYKDTGLYDYYKLIEKGKKTDDVLVKRFNDLLEEFIVYGGYPRVVTSSDNEERQEVLRNILNIYLLKDVRDILGLTDDYRMFSLIKALALQIGNVISYQELSALTQQHLSTLKKYLNLLEKTFIIHLLKPYFTNKRIELVKNPKVYFYDTGLRNAVAGDFKELNSRQDRGVLYENFIFTELLKKGFSLKYWRTKSKAEVDFVVNDKIPVEVKTVLSRLTIGRSLHSFIEKYHPENAYIFNKGIFEKTRVNKTVVKFLYHFSVTVS
ncbi:MAG: ATP-binding protein, partial [Nitrospirae bacterium]|nr:ATP-binding protein [Nitrospirota bacterium]